MRSFTIKIVESEDPEIDCHINCEVIHDALKEYFPQCTIDVRNDDEFLRGFTNFLKSFQE